MKTAPVLRPSGEVFPGRETTVATSAPSPNAATLLAASLSGINTQPTQVADGVAPRPSMSNASMDSRPPWFVA